MANTKTIEECFKDAGSKFPFKVYSKQWEIRKYFYCVARAPNKDWLGWDNLGSVQAFLGLGNDWELYIEPKPKKKLWPWVVEDISRRGFYEVFYSDGEAKDMPPGFFLVGPHPTFEPIEVDDEY